MKLISEVLNSPELESIVYRVAEKISNLNYHDIVAGSYIPEGVISFCGCEKTETRAIGRGEFCKLVDLAILEIKRKRKSEQRKARKIANLKKS